jgi:signal transduction histidine kinase/CheY-like chemotaxis protein
MEEANAPRLHVAFGRQMRLSALGQDEALHWRQLAEIVRALTRTDSVNALLQYFLTATLELLEADRGHVQLLNEPSGEFQIRAQHGFDELGTGEMARVCNSPLHGRTLRTHARVLVEDIQTSQLFEDDATRAALLSARCRAGQATPLLTSEHKILGVLTTYTEVPVEPDGLRLRLLDVLCMQVAELLQRATEKEALLEAARRKDDFLATLAHELRNAVAPLRSSLEILKLATLEHPLHERARAILDRRLDHTTRLIEDLMDASRAARGKLQLQCERIALADVLESAVEAAGPILSEFQHELTTTLPDRDILVDGDAVRLTQVFVNLLSNAAKYTPSGGRIELRTARQGSGVQVEVRDNGIGIMPEALPHLFEMFSQAPLGESRRQGGLGIGLALVKNVIALHGGAVAVSSDGRNKGSTFTVWLPTLAPSETGEEVSEAPASSATRTPSRPQATPLRILVVDDDVDSTESMASLLALRGHDVRVAYDGVEAVEITSRFYPDLILLDLVMPRMGGLEAAEHIRQLPLPRQPEIIELTGHEPTSELVREDAAGIAGHILKPVELPVLDQVLAVTARNLSVMRETGAQFLINNIDLSLTLLVAAQRNGNDPANRRRCLENARRAYQRALGLVRMLKLQPEQMLAIEGRLRRLEAELTATDKLL